MKIYFAQLKSEVSLKELKVILLKNSIKILKYYPNLNIVKLHSPKEMDIKKYDSYLESLEEEKSDFGEA